MKKAETIFFGRNILKEALNAQVPISKIFYETSAAKTFASSLSAVKKRNIPLDKELPREVKHQAHQGVAFSTSHEFYRPLSATHLQNYPFVVLLNKIEDVHNFGSIARCAGAFGARLIIHEAKNSASLTPAAVKASAGVAFHINFVMVDNLSQPLLELSKLGFHTVGLDARENSVSLFDWVPEFPMAMVLGSEGDGISSNIKSRLEILIQIPMQRSIESLNVSHAAAIAMNWAYKSESKLKR